MTLVGCWWARKKLSPTIFRLKRPAYHQSWWQLFSPPLLPPAGGSDDWTKGLHLYISTVTKTIRKIEGATGHRRATREGEDVTIEERVHQSSSQQGSSNGVYQLAMKTRETERERETEGVKNESAPMMIQKKKTNQHRGRYLSPRLFPNFHPSAHTSPSLGRSSLLMMWFSSFSFLLYFRLYDV